MRLNQWFIYLIFDEFKVKQMKEKTCFLSFELLKFGDSVINLADDNLTHITLVSFFLFFYFKVIFLIIIHIFVIQ